jgi:hypothetical protein
VNNIIKFAPGDHARAVEFQKALLGESVLVKQQDDQGWAVQFSQQRVGPQVVYFARLPDGRVVSRKSKTVLGSVVAVIHSQSFMEGLRGSIWLNAEREFELLQDDARGPVDPRNSSRREAARQAVEDFKDSARYAAHKVSERNLTPAWDAMSWRSTSFHGHSYAAKLRQEDRWSDVLVLDVYGGK